MRLSKLAAAVAALSLGAGAAQAAVTLTFTGTVTSGTDGAGLFGAAGSDLAGLSFTSIYVFDDTNALFYPDSGYEQMEGGTAIGRPSPLVSAALTINGITQAAHTDFYAFAALQNALGVYTHEYYHRIRVSAVDVPPGDLLRNTCDDFYSLTPPSGGCPTGSDGAFRLAGSSTFGVLAATSASASPPLPLGTNNIPEPMTWALMITGFGMVGATLRRRRPEAA